MLFTKSEIAAQVKQLLIGRDRSLGLEKEGVVTLDLTFEGVGGDFHRGPTNTSGSDLLGLYPRGSKIRNARQVTLVSLEELADIAARMGIPTVKAEWLGANIVTAGIAELSLMPPSTRLQFPSGATLVVDIENEPCRQVAEVIGRHHPEAGLGFIKAAKNRRGIAAWVEREGSVAVGDAIAVWLPPQRIYRAVRA
jgi:hypothetical protein